MSGHITYDELDPLLQKKINSSKDVNLENYYDKDRVDIIVNNKVDKEEGKGLSTNDFTNEYKDKLERLSSINIEVSNSDSDTEAMKKALNSVQLNPTVVGTLANKIVQLGNGLSDGMKNVADAITVQGVPTQATDSIDTIVENISKIELVENSIKILTDTFLDSAENKLPVKFKDTPAIFINDELHFFGLSRNLSGDNKQHYKLNKFTNTWEKMNSLPCYFVAGDVMFLNDKIYLVDSYNYKLYIGDYKTDTWSLLMDLQFMATEARLIYVNDTMYIFNHYNIMQLDLVSNTYTIINNEVSHCHEEYILGPDNIVYQVGYYGQLVDPDKSSYDSYTGVRKYNFSTNKWEWLPDMISYISNCNLVIVDDDIHIFDNYSHYKYNIKTYECTKLSDLPTCTFGSSVLYHNGMIHIIGGPDQTKDGTTINIINSVYANYQIFPDGESNKILISLPKSYNISLSDKFEIISDTVTGSYRYISIEKG